MYGGYYSPTDTDLRIVQQENQERYLKLEILNRDLISIAEITGDCVSASFNIDKNSHIRRTANIVMNVKPEYVVSETINYKLIAMDRFIKIQEGILDNITRQVVWYNKGTYIVKSNGYSYNDTTNQLTVNGLDMMALLTAEFGGSLPYFGMSLVAGESIQQAIIKILEECYIYNCYVADIVGMVNGQLSNLIPYDLTFSIGMCAIDMLEKLVKLYPSWEMFFDVDGTFIVQKETLEDNNEIVVYTDTLLSKLLIDESRNVDYDKVFNAIAIYGKDGVYYGEAKDNTVNSPFCVGSMPIRWKVFSGDMYDSITTNEQANEWAKQMLYENTRLKDTITLTLLNIPFIDVGCKITYRTKADNQLATYIINAVDEDFANCTCTLTCIKFYSENTMEYRPKLSAPVITCGLIDNVLTINIANEVPNATSYTMYVDGAFIIMKNTTIITYTFPDTFLGEHVISCRAVADGLNDSDMSNLVTLDFVTNIITTNTDDYLVTNTGDYFAYFTE